jgi:hypothetical protein
VNRPAVGSGVLRAALAGLAGLLLAAAAAGAAAGEPTFTRVELGVGSTDEPLDAEWHLPAGGAAPSALVVLQHGFTRRCAHLRTLAANMADAGLATVCLNAEMARGNPGLARAWADRLTSQDADALHLPDGRPLPTRLIVAGHSAGAHFAAIVGERLDERAPDRLAGALMLDPVSAGPHFGSALERVSDDGRRPVRALLAEPHGCNAQGNARVPLLTLQDRARAAGRDQVIGLRIAGGTHGDAEGPDTDLLAGWLCGAVHTDTATRWRLLSVQWVVDMATGTGPLRPPAAQDSGETGPELLPLD